MAFLRRLQTLRTKDIQAKPHTRACMKPIRAKDNFLVFGRPVIEQAEIDEVRHSLEAQWLGTGPKVARFEKDFAAYTGAPYAVAVNSCTAALHISCIAAGVGAGDEVITTPLTFCASVNAIIHAGAQPVLADVNPRTMNISPQAIAEKITPKTKAVLPVHFAGRPCDMDAIHALCEQHGLVLLEDCAHAIETRYKGRAAGTFGDFGCFSFYATKNVCTGEGGMIVTHNKEHAAKLKILALHGLSSDAWKRFSDDGYKHYFVTEAGFKYNMMDLQAALGIHQLNRVEQNWRRRRDIWRRYDDALQGLPVTLPLPTAEHERHALHLYTILIDEQNAPCSRDEFLEAMTFHNIGVGVHYMSVPEHPYYQERFGWRPQATPNALRIGRQTVSLPLSPDMSEQDVNDVIEAVQRTLSR